MKGNKRGLNFIMMATCVSFAYRIKLFTFDEVIIVKHPLIFFLLLALSSSVICLSQPADTAITQEQSAVTDVSVLIEKDMFRAKELKKELSRQR